MNVYVNAALVTLVMGLNLTPSGAFAGEASATLTLDQAIEEALKNSPQVQAAEAAVQESSWKHFETLGQGFLPRISANIGHYFAEEYEDTTIAFGGQLLNFPGIFPTTQYGLNVNIPLFDGFANVNHLKAAARDESAAEGDYERAKFELTQNIRLAFYQALAAAQLDEVAEQNVKTLEDHLREVDIQRHGGAATNYDTLRVSVQLSEARADAIDAKDNVTLSRRKLTELLGIDEDSRPLEGVLPAPDASRVKDLQLSGVPTERTDIEALDRRAESADYNRGANAAWLVPTVSLGGQLMFYNELTYTAAGSIVDPQQYEKAYNVGLFLTWNLFDGGVAWARSREASYQQVQADSRARAAKLQVPYDFAYWKRHFLSNTDHYEARKLDVARSEESVRLAKEEERAGTRTSTETLDAELDLFRAKAGVVNAQVSAAEAEIRLELALGRRI